MAAELSGWLPPVDLVRVVGYRPAMTRWCLLLLMACGGQGPVGDPTAGEPASIGLAYTAPTVLELPPTSRPEGKVPKRWRVRGKWEKLRSKDGRDEYGVRLPYRLVFYGSEGGALPEGMRLEMPKGTRVLFEQQKRRMGTAGTWGIKKNQLIFRVKEGQGPPEQVWVRVPGATTSERSMNMDTAKMAPNAFAFRTLDRRNSQSHGLFLPAPGKVQWSVRVPQRGRLSIDAELLSPPTRSGQRSDGAAVVVSVDAGQGAVTVLRQELKPGKQQMLEAELMPWAGETVTLTVQTEAGETPDLDYVFLADPVLYTPSESPNRMLVVFVDTLRQDHLSTYGYTRTTSPVIDALGAEGVVFEQARAPSPWTLPSALAAMYGRSPEVVAGQPHLGEQLGAEGWASCAVVSNNWLTAPDTLGSGWSQQRARRGAKASEQTKRALKCLEDYADRDALVFVHFIDPHFPYMESDEYRGRFEGDVPAELPSKIRHNHVRDAYAAAQTDEDRAAIRRHIVDRYDQNILAVDAAVGDLLESVGEDATVALFSDHGEEFWEHGGFEHGHTLYDELVLVPMLIRVKGLTPARIASSVGLMDLVPTLRESLGLAALAPVTGGGTQGQSLLSMARGDVAATQAIEKRPISLGRVLFGDDQWGVVHQGKKWVWSAGAEQLWDLPSDPKERRDLAKDVDLSGYPAHLGAALHRPVARVLRVAGPGVKRHMAGGSSTLKLSHPSAIQAAWTRLDAHGSLADPVLESGAVSIQTSKGQKAPRELFVQLGEGVKAAGLQLEWTHGGTTHSGTVPAKNTDGILYSLGPEQAPMTVRWAWQPLPLAEGGVTYSGDVTDELKALGYIE